jgi:chitinase
VRRRKQRQLSRSDAHTEEATTAKRRRRRLSLPRVLLALVSISAIGAGSVSAVRRGIADFSKPAVDDPWFAPYVDVTATPQFHFEDTGANPANDAVLGFVVASHDGACTPTWGTYFDIPGAARALDLDRRIARMRQRGGDVVVSFGGAANDELATRCTTDEALSDAYRAVIDHYELTTIDFDIEGASLHDADANARRARVTKRLQDTARADHGSLAVWLTLPVSPSGLGDDATAAIDAMLAARVDLAGVNLMTMDYGASRGGKSMIAATTAALDATHVQLDAAYRRAGMRLADEAVWHKLGATPMIGQNDERDERFTVKDAKRLLHLVDAHGLGRVSMWSANRDMPCGAQLDLGVVSNQCSGIAQQPLAFTNVFNVLPGRAATAAEGRTVVDSTPEPVDDPARSPYPVWRDTKVYTQGTKVTWHHNVYEAKWWSREDTPDAPVRHAWDTPWRYLGPVLPGDHPVTTDPSLGGKYPTWSHDDVYVKGDRVVLDGVSYEAQWWTQGDEPNPDVDVAWENPWVRLQVDATATPTPDDAHGRD